MKTCLLFLSLSLETEEYVLSPWELEVLGEERHTWLSGAAPSSHVCPSQVTHLPLLRLSPLPVASSSPYLSPRPSHRQTRPSLAHSPGSGLSFFCPPGPGICTFFLPSLLLLMHVSSAHTYWASPTWQGLGYPNGLSTLEDSELSKGQSTFNSSQAAVS